MSTFNDRLRQSMNEKGTDATLKRARELDEMREKLIKEEKKDIVQKAFEMGMTQNHELLKKLSKE